MNRQTLNWINLHMCKRIAGIVMIAASLFAAAARAAAPATAPTSAPAAADPADAVIAENLTQLSQVMLATGSIDNVALREAACAMEASMRLNPNDSRYPRLLSEAYLQLHDVDGALNATRAYLKLEPAE